MRRRGLYILLVIGLMWAAFLLSTLPAYGRCMDRSGWWNPLSKVHCELEILRGHR